MPIKKKRESKHIMGGGGDSDYSVSDTDDELSALDEASVVSSSASMRVHRVPKKRTVAPPKEKDAAELAAELEADTKELGEKTAAASGGGKVGSSIAIYIVAGALLFLLVVAFFHVRKTLDEDDGGGRDDQGDRGGDQGLSSRADEAVADSVRPPRPVHHVDPLFSPLAFD